jgi:hypothetical protein
MKTKEFKNSTNQEVFFEDVSREIIFKIKFVT